MSELSARDRELFARFGLDPEQVEADVRRVESESADDGLTGVVYYGSHFDRSGEEMTTVSVRIPVSDLERISAHAAQYHISRSEYIRRCLASA